MIIRKGKHKPNGEIFPALRLGYTIERRRVWFDTNCRYDIGSDQTDINKVFGVAYVSWTAIGFMLKSYWRAIVKRSSAEIKKLHHYNSIRFGWYYNPLIDKIEIYTYGYHNGERFFDRITSVSFYKTVDMIIEANGDVHTLNIYNYSGFLKGYAVTVRSSFIAYSLGLYFGGNRPAPHDMQIVIK